MISGVSSMIDERDRKTNENRSLFDENKRLRITTEALETENLLLQIQVSDLNQSVEELEDDLISIKTGRKADTRGSHDQRVTFRDERDGRDGKKDEKLESLIQTAKERCKNLEKQVRSNTSWIKTTQYENEDLFKAQDDLRRENCNLRQYLEECERTNKILLIKISELKDRLQSIDDNKSLDDMEKQSLLDRLKIFEGQIKFLKIEKETLRTRIDKLQRESNNLDVVNRSPYSKFIFFEPPCDSFAPKRNNLKDEVARLKCKVKKQSTQSRVLQSEIFEFLDDVRCLENEILTIVYGEFPGSFDGRSMENGRTLTCSTVLTEDRNRNLPALLWLEQNTWDLDTSLCQENGMAPIMSEIVDHLKSTWRRLHDISGNVDDVTGNPNNSLSVKVKDLKEQLHEEILMLRNEKEVLRREVSILKTISENFVDDEPRSTETVHVENEKYKTPYLRKQILNSIERNTKLESQILDYLNQKFALERELERLKEGLINLKNEKETLLSLNSDKIAPCADYSNTEEIPTYFYHVKNHVFQPHDVLKVVSDGDNEDLLSWCV